LSPAPRKSPARRSITANRRARHEYLVLEEIEAGIVLAGTEAKSLRQGRCSIAEAYATIRRGEMWLHGMHIPEYSHGNALNHVPVRDRKLLAHRREIAKWEKQVRERGVTLVPLELYFQGPWVKVTIGLCRGKKFYDKRESQREKESERDIERELKRRR
jgi:SsrA-binding protein